MQYNKQLVILMLLWGVKLNANEYLVLSGKVESDQQTFNVGDFINIPKNESDENQCSDTYKAVMESTVVCPFSNDGDRVRSRTFFVLKKVILQP